MKKKQLTKMIIFVLLPGLLAACATPPEVRKLADKTAANVGTIGVHMQRLARNSQDIAAVRADNISRLHAVNTELRASYEYDVELTKKAGGAANLSLIPQIKAWADKVQQIFAKAERTEAQRKKQILATQTKLDTKSKALAEIAQALATLAVEDKPVDRVRFLTGYALDLRKEIDKALEADNKTAKDAKTLLESTKDKLNPKPLKEGKNGGE